MTFWTWIYELLPNNLSGLLALSVETHRLLANIPGPVVATQLREALDELAEVIEK